MVDSRYWTKHALSRRRFLGTSATAGVGLAGAALIGCGGGGTENGGGGTATQAPGGGGAATQAPSGGSTPEATGDTARDIIGDNYSLRHPDMVPVYGGTLNWAAGSPVLANLDYTQSASAMVHQVSAQVYSQLTHIGREPDDRNSPHIHYPELATSWEISDPLRMVFTLREGVTFHDRDPVNGRPLLAEDIKYAFEFARDSPTSRHGGTLEAIESIETPDDHTLVINTSSFDPLLFTSLGNQPGWVVPREIIDDGTLTERMIGSGPFIFEEWELDSRLRYTRNPDYFIPGVPFVDELNILQIGNQEARSAAFQSGQTAMYDVPSEDLDQFEGNEEIVIEPYLRVEPRVIFMKADDPRFEDVRVRRAISLAVDTDVILEINGQGRGLWRGIVSNQHGGWTLSQDELKGDKYYLRYNIEEAKKLMQAAGFPDGIESGLLFNTSYPQTYQDSVQYVAEQWTSNGIVNTSPYGQEHATMRRNQDEHNYDGMVFGLDGQGAPEAFLIDYRTGGPKNGSGLSNAEMDESINEVLSTVDVTERQEAAKAWTERWLPEVMWKIEFIDLENYEGYRTDVYNYTSTPGFQYTSGFGFTWLGEA